MIGGRDTEKGYAWFSFHGVSLGASLLPCVAGREEVDVCNESFVRKLEQPAGSQVKICQITVFFTTKCCELDFSFHIGSRLCIFSKVICVNYLRHLHTYQVRNNR
jgi:hypothetical protein